MIMKVLNMLINALNFCKFIIYFQVPRHIFSGFWQIRDACQIPNTIVNPRHLSCNNFCPVFGKQLCPPLSEPGFVGLKDCQDWSSFKASRKILGVKRLQNDFFESCVKPSNCLNEDSWDWRIAKIGYALKKVSECQTKWNDFLNRVKGLRQANSGIFHLWVHTSSLQFRLQTVSHRLKAELQTEKCEPPFRQNERCPNSIHFLIDMQLPSVYIN